MSQEVHYIPLENISESPFNHRKAFPEAELRELADSIKDIGVMQPIVVRLVPESQAELYFRYEAIVGHRRLRASALAGLERIPALVVEKTDEEVVIMQLHENMKRTNPSAIEEADGFLHLTKAHKMKADAIAEAVGKSRSYVYARLKLARSAPEVRKACEEQGLSAETAQDIAAQVPHHDLQRAALKQIRVPHLETKERPIVWQSVRDARITLDRAFSQSIDDAEFDTTDEHLHGRVGSCTACPHRAGNNPELSHLSPGTCLDRSCFKHKEEAHQRQLAAKLAAAGHKVIDGEEAKALMPNAWTRPLDMTPVFAHAFTKESAAESEEDTHVNFADILEDLGDAAPRITYVVSPHDGKVKGFITSEQKHTLLQAAGQAAESEPDARTWPGNDDDDEDDEADSVDDRPIEVRAVADYRKWPLVQEAIMRAASAGSIRTSDELKFVACALLDGFSELPAVIIELMGWRERYDALEADEEHSNVYGWEIAAAIDLVQDLRDAEVARLSVLLAIHCGPVVSAMAEDTAAATIAEKLRTAALYGVDVVQAAGMQPAEPKGSEQQQLDMLETMAPAGTATPVTKQSSKPTTKYRNAATGETWSGRGLQPKWLKAAILAGAKLEDFDACAAPATLETEAAE